MANERIPASKRALILAALCEGMAINSVCRMFKTGKHAVLRVIKETGEACEDWHNRHFTGLKISRLELDEQWAYVHTHRERMSKEEKRQNPDRGDCWLWASLDPDSKAIINWHTGKRTHREAMAFTADLASRISGRVQITSDKLASYENTLTDLMGERVDYCHEEKVFLKDKTPGHEWVKYSTNPLVGVKRNAVKGNPNLSTSTTSHVERFFLTVRQGNKRCARKTLAYSKLWDNHALTASIHIFVYNLVRRHETTKTTPAMALGVTERRWTLEDVVAMTESYLSKQEEAAFEAAFERLNPAPKATPTVKVGPVVRTVTNWFSNENTWESELP